MSSQTFCVLHAWRYSSACDLCVVAGAATERLSAAVVMSPCSTAHFIVRDEWVSSVSVVTEIRAGWPGIRVPPGAALFFFQIHFKANRATLQRQLGRHCGTTAPPRVWCGAEPGTGTSAVSLSVMYVNLSP
jgi:hypothetical protein